MAMDEQGVVYVDNFMRTQNEIALLLISLTDQEEIYVSRGYSSITDQDLIDSNFDITAANLSDGINLVRELNNLLGNSVVTQGDWKGILDRIRRLL